MFHRYLNVSAHGQNVLQAPHKPLVWFSFPLFRLSRWTEEATDIFRLPRLIEHFKFPWNRKKKNIEREKQIQNT